ncbi:dipeptidase [Vitiosangium sp. GDMCC 1.1324]|uniref:dipeptidase n=1 Tax=Vitiosangium sp. (strain GDMCC 1.1324) TaxID=2138576 RepID=UPI000D344813|nr:dipeptidase [Vitiosangium sp. GDMCC 1.1324]PTL85441.1 peptidase M19 [Vitiosangium sp. GDMCC 1.1324]
MRPTTALLSLVLLATPACTHGTNIQETAPTDLAERGRALARRVMIADGHIDVPYRLKEKLGPDGEPTEDVSQRTAEGDFDYPRAMEGGLDVAFMSIYIPAEYQEKGGAKALADSLIDMVEKLARKSPEKFAMARSVEEARHNSQEGKVSFAMGIENGAAIEDKLENVAHFQKRGVRYITLTHSKDNQISDASFNQGKRAWNGLSPFGKQVVAEMNRVGIMVDVAHLSDDAIRQAVELSQVPVIASHSSCRHFTPGFERNISDELIRAVAAKGGVVMINFGSAFLIQAVHAYEQELTKAAESFAQARSLAKESPEMKTFVESYLREHPMPLARVEDVADHIAHVVKLVGIDHVGLGSDFDGVGPTLPTGLKDVSQYPNLFRVLLERGYSEADIEKIASGNVFRVWQQVEAHAARL